MENIHEQSLQCGWCGNVFTHDCPEKAKALSLSDDAYIGGEVGGVYVQKKRVGGFDANPHPSVQEWSRGPLFPAVIFRTERYSEYLENFHEKWWSVILDGVVEEGLSTYDEAEQCARGMLAQRAARVVA